MRRHILPLLVAAAAVCGVEPAQGQQVVGFLHGLNDGPGVWYSSATSLASTFGFYADRPTLPSTFTYEDQRSSIAGRYGTTGILVGHSNGGIVARYYGRNQHVRGVVTFGSPNWGAPIVANSGIVTQYFGHVAFDALEILQYIPYFPAGPASASDGHVVFAATALASIADFFLTYTGWLGNPVQSEMVPGSAYVSNVMNGSAAVAAESSNIEVEGSVVFTTTPDGAVFRLLSPDNGALISSIVDDVGYTMLAEAAYVYLTGNWDDPYVMEAASHFDLLGLELISLDYLWCAVVTGTYACYESDGLVPTWSQNLGRGFVRNVLDSPIHTAEPPTSGVPVLEEVLRTYFGY